MSRERVVLCSMNTATPGGMPGGSYSISIRTLASHLRTVLPARRFEVSVLDLPGGLDVAAAADAVEALAPGVLGLSCYVWNYGYLYELADEIKRRMPGTATLLGGPQLFYDEDDVRLLFERHRGIDVVIRGEGELALADYLSASRSVRPGRGTVIDGRALPDLTRIHAPLYGAFPTAEPTDVLYIETMRGCKSRCAFCVIPATRAPVRTKSRAQVESEFAWAVSAGVSTLVYADASLNHVESHLRDVVEASRAVDPCGTLSHGVEIDFRLLNVEQIGLLDGFVRSVGVGLQSGNERTFRPMHRRLARRKLEWAVRELKRIGINVALEIILGLPGDTREGFFRTLDYALSLDCSLVVSVLFVLPGSDYYRRRKEYGIVYDETLGHQLRSHRTMSESDVEACVAHVREIMRGSPDRKCVLWRRDCHGSFTRVGPEEQSGRAGAGAAARKSAVPAAPGRRHGPEFRETGRLLSRLLPMERIRSLLPEGWSARPFSAAPPYHVLRLSGGDRVLRIGFSARDCAPAFLARTEEFDIAVLADGSCDLREDPEAAAVLDRVVREAQSAGRVADVQRPRGGRRSR
jgi:hypothetical protein